MLLRFIAVDGIVVDVVAVTVTFATYASRWNRCAGRVRALHTSTHAFLDWK